ncbi:hypothetical protein M747DRAFT_328720 [Aspergillus niger ATCC 13496]|nr:hypothetical protein M747DRAFT_328720 [Aspergillus niger ATCC 13496]
MSKKRERYERDEEIENVEEVAFRKQKEQQQQQQQQSKLSSSAAAAADLLTNKSVSQSVMSRSGYDSQIPHAEIHPNLKKRDMRHMDRLKESNPIETTSHLPNRKYIITPHYYVNSD